MMFFGVILMVSSAVLASVFGSTPGPCPAMWQLWNGACYRITEHRTTWAGTKAACQAMGGQLATPNSPQESHFIAQTAKGAGEVYLWIACSYTGEGKWECEGQGTGEVEFFLWNDSPSNSSGNCAYLISQEPFFLGKWFDYPCHIQYHGVCVIRGPTPSTRARHHLFTIATNTTDPDHPTSCLVDHVIKEFVITSIPSCAFACIKEPRCRSINIKITEEGGQKVCQLNDSTRFDAPNDFQNPGVVCVYYSLDQ